MKNLYVMVGLPGSGKTTWAKNHSYFYDVYVSSDEIRNSAPMQFLKRSNENKYVFEKVFNKAEHALEDNLSVCIDATNIIKRDRRKLISRFKNKADNIIAICMMADVYTCKVRNSHRDNPVQAELIDIYDSKYIPPTKEEGFTDILYAM